MARKKKVASVWDIVTSVLPHSKRVLLCGPPGTGKTHFALHAGLNGDQVYTVTLTEEMPAAELRGHYVPFEGRFMWQDGPGIAAWRAGARLVVNEIQRASGDLVGLLLALLDDPDFACLTLPTNETVRPMPGFHVIATMNGDLDQLDSALRDRFPVAMSIEEVHPEALESLPKDLRTAAQSTCLQEDARRLSVRVWLEFAHLREQLGEDMAARACFSTRANEVLDALKVARS